MDLAFHEFKNYLIKGDIQLDSIIKHVNKSGNDMNKYASYLKRLISTVIDFICIYSFNLILGFLLIKSYGQLWLDKYQGIITFIYSMFFLNLCYKNLGRTVGDKLLKIRPAFEVEVKNETKLIFKRTFIQSLIYVPYASPACLFVSLLILIFSLLSILLDKEMRSRKIFLWDAVTKMVVIDDKYIEQ